MKTGNPTQAIALSIAAVGAIGFLVTRLIPAKPVLADDGHGQNRASVGKLASISGLPTDVYRDAFSHPALAKRVESLSKADAVVTPEGDAQESAFYKFMHGPIQILPPTTPQESFSTERESPKDEATKPSVSTEKSQQLEKTAQLKIGLKAIMRATKPIALITLDGQPDGNLELLVSPGDQLTGTLKVGHFSESAVELISPTGKFWVSVGSEVAR